MEKKVILTISRQYGSGGKEIAEILARKLGVWCYDRDILTMAAERIGKEEVTEEMIAQLNYKRGGIGEGGITGVMGVGNIPVYNQMFLEQAKIIKKLADYGSAVFLGRCADYILRDCGHHFSVYLYADDKFRRQRVEQVYHESADQIRKEDKIRADYYEYYTGQKWGDLKNYDLALNTSKIDFETAAEIILEYIRKGPEKIEEHF